MDPFWIVLIFYLVGFIIVANVTYLTTKGDDRLMFAGSIGFFWPIIGMLVLTIGLVTFVTLPAHWITRMRQ